MVAFGFLEGTVWSLCTGIILHTRMYSYGRALYFYNICVDLVMLTWNKHEVIAVPAVVIILLTLFGPHAPILAVLPEWFWNPLDMVMNREFVRREI